MTFIGTYLSAVTGTEKQSIKDGLEHVLDLTNTGQEARLRTLQTLQESLARQGYIPPAVGSSLPTIAAATSSSAVSGTSYDFTVGSSRDNLFTFVGGDWGPIGASYPNSVTWRGTCAHQGNGTDPSANPIPGGKVRFSLEADVFEIWCQTTAAGSGNGIRVKFIENGRLVLANASGVIANDGNGLYRYIKFTFASVTPRYFELDFGATGAFVGIKCATIYKPSPWPQADGLRVLQHGDSLVGTVVDSGNKDTALTGYMGQVLGDLIGQADYWRSGEGGAGWLAPAVKDRSYFNDRVAIDVVDVAPDVIIEHGGGNDVALSPTQDQMTALVTTWLSTVITAKPETIIFMTGPLVGVAASASHLTIAAAKRAAAALFPQNVAYIDNFTDPWVYGSGKQTATTGDGNRDWVTGSDGAHPTIAGAAYFASRIARAVAASIPALIAANA